MQRSVQRESKGKKTLDFGVEDGLLGEGGESRPGEEEVGP